jgi:LacI family transcriptional regulator
VGTESIVGGVAALRTLPAEHPEVDSVIVFNDLMVLRVIRAAHAPYLEVPSSCTSTAFRSGSPCALSRRARRSTAEVALALVDNTLGSERQVLSRSHITVPRPLWRKSA